MAFSISIVIPVYNYARQLDLCLKAVAACRHEALEVIVVDDGSTDDSRDVAARAGGMVLSTGGRKGASSARNTGARAASGDVILFLDSDVCVRPGVLAAVRETLVAHPEVDALMGSYDDHPYSAEFLSQYRNLMHRFIHKHGNQRASTFWGACGAIRRNVFLSSGGFAEDWSGIEDIEFGYRLVRAGHRILLIPGMQVQHLKRWTLWGMLKTDIFMRAIPWTELILRDKFMPNDLNLQTSQRWSVVLVFLMAGLGVLAIGWRPLPFIAAFAGVLAALLFRYWIEFFFSSKWCDHRVTQMAITAAILGVVGFACVSLPRHPVLVAGIVTLALLIGLNARFYGFLAQRRGVPFMLAAIPFHLLYHFYSGASLLTGIARHLLRRQATA